MGGHISAGIAPVKVRDQRHAAAVSKQKKTGLIER